MNDVCVCVCVYESIPTHTIHVLLPLIEHMSPHIVSSRCTKAEIDQIVEVDPVLMFSPRLDGKLNRQVRLSTFQLRR